MLPQATARSQIVSSRLVTGLAAFSWLCVCGRSYRTRRAHQKLELYMDTFVYGMDNIFESSLFMSLPSPYPHYNCMRSGVLM